MAEWLDVKYIGIISSRLEKFKLIKSSPYTATFRCFLCGDSQKNKYKTRGYFITKNGKVAMYCHNCNNTLSVQKVLEHFDPTLMTQYKTECFIDKNNHFDEPKIIKPKVEDPKFEQPNFKKDNYLKKLKSISQLSWDHPAKQYIISRQIPNSAHRRLYYSPNFSKWVNSIIPEKLNEKNSEPRLVIPMLDKEGVMIGFSGRAFHDTTLRYITIMIDNDAPKIFGLDCIDWSKTVYCCEGQLDSLFLPNCIAMVGADLIDMDHFKDVKIIFDNEPRNHQIVERMNKYINKGFDVCIWPDKIKNKDINNMILKEGLTKEKVLDIINSNLYNGLSAKLKLSSWRKC